MRWHTEQICITRTMQSAGLRSVFAGSGRARPLRTRLRFAITSRAYEPQRNRPTRSDRTFEERQRSTITSSPSSTRRRPLGRQVLRRSRTSIRKDILGRWKSRFAGAREARRRAGSEGERYAKINLRKARNALIKNRKQQHRRSTRPMARLRRSSQRAATAEAEVGRRGAGGRAASKRCSPGRESTSSVRPSRDEASSTGSCPTCPHRVDDRDGTSVVRAEPADSVGAAARPARPRRVVTRPYKPA